MADFTGKVILWQVHQKIWERVGRGPRTVSQDYYFHHWEPVGVCEWKSGWSTNPPSSNRNKCGPNKLVSNAWTPIIEDPSNQEYKNYPGPPLTTKSGGNLPSTAPQEFNKPMPMTIELKSSLPDGLTFDTETGILTGTPTMLPKYTISWSYRTGCTGPGSPWSPCYEDFEDIVLEFKNWFGSSLIGTATGIVSIIVMKKTMPGVGSGCPVRGTKCMQSP